VAQPTNNVSGEIDVYVPACGSIKPYQNFQLQMDGNSGNQSNYGVGLITNGSGTGYDKTAMRAATGSKSNVTFYLDNSCNLWTTSGQYSTGKEKGFIDTSSPSADPQWYFGASLPTNQANYALPTCFVDTNNYFTCTRPPPPGTTSSFTIFYSCPNFWRLGFNLPPASSGLVCSQLNIRANALGTTSSP